MLIELSGKRLLTLALLGGGAVLLMAAEPGQTNRYPVPGREPFAASHSRPMSGAAWCSEHRLGTLSATQRLEGQNLARLKAAQAELAPGFVTGKATTGLHILASYQEELEKPRPDTATAASYLALVSTVPVTAARLRQVNALLCISTTRRMAQTLETEAETLRKQMSRR
ncbi:MAG: hypothetical protein KGI51_09560 [Rhodospirillales bacterium]|nr:hypothetical protein [Rhodospirillales bacterium]